MVHNTLIRKDIIETSLDNSFFYWCI